MLVRNVFVIHQLCLENHYKKNWKLSIRNCLFSGLRIYIKNNEIKYTSIIPKYLTKSRQWSNSMTYSSKYKKNIKIDIIKIMLYSIKNFKFSFKSSFLWYLKFTKNFIELILMKILLTK